MKHTEERKFVQVHAADTFIKINIKANQDMSSIQVNLYEYVFVRLCFEICISF